MTSPSRAECKGFFAAAIVGIIAVAGIAGCGGGSPSPLMPTTVTGNWELSATTTSSKGTIPLPVYLLSNGTIVQGMVIKPPEPLVCIAGCCGGPLSTMDPSLTGTIDASGNLKLGSVPASGSPVFTMTGMVSNATLSNGSYTLTGSCGAQGAMTGTEYPPLNGTYTGTVMSNNLGQNLTITLVLEQSSAPNSSGFLNLTGTIGISGYSCFPSTTSPISTSFVGSSFGGTLSPGPKEAFGYGGTLSPDGKTIAFSYGLDGTTGSCNGDYGKGTLTLQ